MEKIKADVTVKMWTEQPDVAEYAMNSASQAASDWNAAGWWVTGGLGLALLTNLAVRYGSGPFGGVLELVLKAFKKEAPPELAARAENEKENIELY